ncbi:neurofilament medium polypeptide [Eurosta solidaginis]|uniref:neurofilament medium polypeptide n=1 Tax=Eurosta solidaginis TaxID=178769 RepID=UPI0035312632
MNYLIQRGKVRNQMINVPKGLPELLSDITREVLRCQPTSECLCQFIIDYLHSLIVTREKARVAKGIIDRALSVVDEIIADMCVCDISKDKAQEMALHMEQCFRRFLTRMRCEQRKDIEVISFDESDMLDAMIERCKFTEHELKITKPMIEAAYRRFVDAYMKAHQDFEGTEELYQYFKERDLKRLEAEKSELAATKIQAIYRGYKVRRELIKRDTKQETEEEVDSDLLAIQDQAARTIQKAMRRYMSSLESEKLQKEDPEVCEPASDIKVAIPDTTEQIPAAVSEPVLEEEIPVEIELETSPEQDHDIETDTKVEPEPFTDQEPEPPLLEPEPQPEESEPPEDMQNEAVDEVIAEEASPNEAEVHAEG